jgi:hypothetical protein
MTKYTPAGFLRGAARVFDLGATLSRESWSFERDARAIGSDWFAVGQDMTRALDSAHESVQAGTDRSDRGIRREPGHLDRTA